MCSKWRRLSRPGRMGGSRWRSRGGRRGGPGLPCAFPTGLTWPCTTTCCPRCPRRYNIPTRTEHTLEPGLPCAFPTGLTWPCTTMCCLR
eukprot:4799048-Pyramimonas_sp.AAC.1